MPGWHCTHRSDVAAVGGSREDLELELQLPVKRDPGSAWAQGQPSPVPLTSTGKETVPGHPSALQDTQSYPFWGATGRCFITGLPIPAPDTTTQTPRDHLASTRGCPCQGPALPGDTTYMSLQTPLKAFHHGSESSVEVMCWSMHF